MTTKILITGATGFVGKQVLAILSADSNYSLRLVLRSKNIDKQEAIPQAITIVYTDDLFSENQQFLDDLCVDIDILIHLAWYSKVGDFYHSSENLHCLAGTLNLAKACTRAGVKKVIAIGSCAEYASSDLPLSTDSPVAPQNLYAATKLACYLTLNQYFKQENIQFAWCRLFYLYGDGAAAGKLHPYLHLQLSTGQIAELASGQQIRDYLDVKDAAAQIVKVVKEQCIGVVNICSGRGQSVREIAEQIADIYGRRDLLHFATRPDNLFDPLYVVGEKD